MEEETEQFLDRTIAVDMELVRRGAEDGIHIANCGALWQMAEMCIRDSCWFELYTPSTSAEDYDLINGFKKITSEKELKAGVSGLSVTKADAQGNRYILLSKMCIRDSL